MATQSNLTSVLMVPARLIIAILFIGTLSAAQRSDSLRQRLSFNDGWLFIKGDPAGSEGRLAYSQIKQWVNATGNNFLLNPSQSRTAPAENPGENVAYTQKGFDDRGWRKLNLPHDWGVEGPFRQDLPGETGKLPWAGIGWYRKHFTIPVSHRTRQIYLDVDGAMAYSTVWLNGKFVGGWPYGYTSFRLDLTPFVEFGRDNVLAIRLDNPPDSSRWYPGSGIYRNVWLVKTGPVHIGQWGTHVTTPEVTFRAADVDLRVTVENHSRSDAEVTLRTLVYELARDGTKRRNPHSFPPVDLRVAPGSHATGSARAHIAAHKFWSTREPNLYAAVTTVEQNGKPIDRYETVFGIRTIKFDADRGFFLNDEHLPLNGVCNHHDLGALGAALNLRALERQIDMLLEMGVNAIRTSHNPPAPELLELCDRKGIVVIDEAFDAWRRAKKKNDYNLLFDDWHEKDVRALLRRDRNHPSIILWSAGNEVPEQRTPEGAQLSAALTRMMHEEDSTRPVVSACNFPEAGYNGFQKTTDVFGYNYRVQEYGRFREKNPTIPFVASETSSAVSSRGEYFFPVSDDKAQGRADFHVSSYDLYAPPWAISPDAGFTVLDNHPYTAGEFVWTGFDYLGEPTPYSNDSTNLLNFSDPSQQANFAKELRELGKIKVPSRSSYFGIIDLAGFKKDRFYIYQARWRPNVPMAHILPHWTWPERVGQVTPVHIYTSGDEAELFLNGRSLGRKKKGAFEYRLRWDDIKYEPGELRAVAYKRGVRWAEDVMQTAEAPAKLLLAADRSRIAADGRDLAFITVSINDRSGRLAPRADNKIRFEISGPGEIVAVDNGDPTSHEPFQSTERRAFNSLALVIVRATRPGQIRLRARSDGLTSAEVRVSSQRVR